MNGRASPCHSFHDFFFLGLNIFSSFSRQSQSLSSLSLTHSSFPLHPNLNLPHTHVVTHHPPPPEKQASHFWKKKSKLKLQSRFLFSNYPCCFCCCYIPPSTLYSLPSWIFPGLRILRPQGRQRMHLLGWGRERRLWSVDRVLLRARRWVHVSTRKKKATTATTQTREKPRRAKISRIWPAVSLTTLASFFRKLKVWFLLFSYLPPPLNQ